MSFDDNVLVNSGNTNFDLQVYKTGTILIELHPADTMTENLIVANNVAFDANSDGFYEFGVIGPNGLDIDNLLFSALLC